MQDDSRLTVLGITAVVLVLIGIPLFALFARVVSLHRVRFLHFVSLLLLGAGIGFGAYSQDGKYPAHTLWGYVVIGLVCLVLGFATAIVTLARPHEIPKGPPLHPLE
jgi:hypothetical protein